MFVIESSSSEKRAEYLTVAIPAASCRVREHIPLAIERLMVCGSSSSHTAVQSGKLQVRGVQVTGGIVFEG